MLVRCLIGRLDGMVLDLPYAAAAACIAAKTHTELTEAEAKAHREGRQPEAPQKEKRKA